MDLSRSRIALSMKSDPVVGPRESRGPRPGPAGPAQPRRQDSRPRPWEEAKPAGSMAEALKAFMDKRRC